MCIPFCNEDEEKRLHLNIVKTDAWNLLHDFRGGDFGSEDAREDAKWHRKMKAPDVKPEAFPNN